VILIPRDDLTIRLGIEQLQEEILRIVCKTTIGPLLFLPRVWIRPASGGSAQQSLSHVTQAANDRSNRGKEIGGWA
jgi:hypothetical protein